MICFNITFVPLRVIPPLSMKNCNFDATKSYLCKNKELALHALCVSGMAQRVVTKADTPGSMAGVGSIRHRPVGAPGRWHES